MLLFVAGCKSKESVTGLSEDNVVTIDNTARYNNMLEGYDTWTTFTTKVSASISGVSISSLAELRMVHDKAIQISLRPLLGIEVARLIMTPDSVFIYDKLHKQYIADATDVFSQLLPFDFTLSNIQNLLLGRPFLLGEGDLSTKDIKQFTIVEGLSGMWQLQPKKQYNAFSYNFFFSNTYLTTTEARHRDNIRKINCHYEYQRITGSQVLPSQVRIVATGGEKEYSLRLSYDSATAVWNSGASIQKLSASGYSRTTLSQILKSLTQ